MRIRYNVLNCFDLYPINCYLSSSDEEEANYASFMLKDCNHKMSWHWKDRGIKVDRSDVAR